jgi:hypothetical protein
MVPPWRSMAVRLMARPRLRMLEPRKKRSNSRERSSVPQHRVVPGVADDERRVLGHHVLAEGAGRRQGVDAVEVRRQAVPADDVHPLVVDEGQQADRRDDGPG